MKKTIIIGFFALLLCSACERRQDEKNSNIFEPDVRPTYDSIYWNSKILAQIDSFVDEANCKECIYEIYVNKVLPNYSLINIKARTSSAAI
jgi:hypothetical protein